MWKVRFEEPAELPLPNTALSLSQQANLRDVLSLSTSEWNLLRFLMKPYSSLVSIQTHHVYVLARLNLLTETKLEKEGVLDCLHVDLETATRILQEVKSNTPSVLDPDFTVRKNGLVIDKLMVLYQSIIITAHLEWVDHGRNPWDSPNHQGPFASVSSDTSIGVRNDIRRGITQFTCAMENSGLDRSNPAGSVSVIHQDRLNKLSEANSRLNKFNSLEWFTELNKVIVRERVSPRITFIWNLDSLHM